MGTTEHTINDAIASLLRRTRRAWKDSNIVNSENTGMLRDSSGRPDIMITEANAFPVVVETEVIPAVTVESEAKDRLGEYSSRTGKEILSSIAVRLPVRLREKEGRALKEELRSATDLELAIFTGNNNTTSKRWPKSGWIEGDLNDLSIYIQSASIPTIVVDKAVDNLVVAVNEAAGLLGEMKENHPNSIESIGNELRQEDSLQTRRMAATILLNAFIFHDNLAGGPGELGDVKSVDQIRGSSSMVTKTSILREWRKILSVNYWPIFDIARRILEQIPTSESNLLIEVMSNKAGELLQHRIMQSQDLTGAIFQRLIADRKFLAAYYTTPASAALLVGLTFKAGGLPNGGSWSNSEDVVSLKIADFACGTGTLLSTAYRRISQLHELNGGDTKTIHPQMMSEALIGCDVLPAAAHLTASMLTGIYPTVKYKKSSILTVGYGKLPNGSLALGSLDLLDPQGTFEILSITAKVAESMGEKEKELWQSLPHASFDVVIMNPPFTRATGHEASKIGVPNPMFAAFSSSEEEQRLMGKATKRLTKNTSAHGNAGEASIFLILAHRKLKIGGNLALVMPLSLISGNSWSKSRELLKSYYSNLIVISIAGEDGAELSFSADTSMGECLVVGKRNNKGSKRATFVILKEKPETQLLGSNIAEQISDLIEHDNLRSLEEGPLGGTAIKFGDTVVGHAIDASLPSDEGWHLSRIKDLSLAQTVYQLSKKNCIWLPTTHKSEAVSTPISTVSQIGYIGHYHADINGTTSSGGIRGPFDVEGVGSNSEPTFPVLWSHDADRERTMTFEAESHGIVKQGDSEAEQKIIEDKVKSVWERSSHCHFNRDFRFNSQSTAMQFTKRKTIGGRAWISIGLSSIEYEKALVLWGNTTFGLLLYWWYANKQQAGRGSIGIKPLRNFPVLDVTALDEQQLSNAVSIFDENCDLELLPLHQIAEDAVRKKIDEQFAINVLGLDHSLTEEYGALDVLRKKLNKEPSIVGHKS